MEWEQQRKTKGREEAIYPSGKKRFNSRSHHQLPFPSVITENLWLPIRKLSLFPNGCDQQTFWSWFLQVLNMIELLGIWHQHTPFLSFVFLLLSLCLHSFSPPSDQHAEGGRVGRVACLSAIAVSWTAWQWPSALWWQLVWIHCVTQEQNVCAEFGVSICYRLNPQLNYF